MVVTALDSALGLALATLLHRALHRHRDVPTHTAHLGRIFRETIDDRAGRAALGVPAKVCAIEIEVRDVALEIAARRGVFRHQRPREGRSPAFLEHGALHTLDAALGPARMKRCSASSAAITERNSPDRNSEPLPVETACIFQRAAARS